MSIGSLAGSVFSVSEILGGPQFDSCVVAVHGVLYLGERWKDELLLLPKDGGFDGRWHDFTKSIPDRTSTLKIDEPNLWEKLIKAGAPRLTGASVFNVDAIVVGRIRHAPEVAISNLWLILMQQPADPISMARPRVVVINLGEGCVPRLPWRGSIEEAGLGVSLQLESVDDICNIRHSQTE